MTREEAFKEINETQDYYVNELARMIDDPGHSSFRFVNFTSPTGTGKTKMMAKLMNLMPNRYFIITTLSRGQLHIQVRSYLQQDCKYDNYDVYGTSDYKINSKLQADEIIGKIPNNTECIWLRDEGHIKTNRFDELLINKCFKVVNFSATNQSTDIKCNFTHTMMLRTVHQEPGTPEDAIKKLIEVKEAHKEVKDYNPCALFRCIDDKITKEVIKICKEYKLKYINITVEDFDMSDLCKDNNEYDVIINKFKITEGIDVRRAHVLYVDNQPSNVATTIQVIGRCRRNALLYRKDIDILSEDNAELLDKTRQCFVFYNVVNMKVNTDRNGELEYAFCDSISIEQLKPNSTIDVVDGKLRNGLSVIELNGQTGKFVVNVDEKTGFNVPNFETDFYKIENEKSEPNYIYIHDSRHYPRLYYQYNVDDIVNKLSINTTKQISDYYDYENQRNVYKEIQCSPYYDLREKTTHETMIIFDKKMVEDELITLLKCKFELCNKGPKVEKKETGFQYTYTKTGYLYQEIIENGVDSLAFNIACCCDFHLKERCEPTKDNIRQFVDKLFLTIRKDEKPTYKKININFEVNKFIFLVRHLPSVYVLRNGEYVLLPTVYRINDQNFKYKNITVKSFYLNLSILDTIKKPYIKCVNDKESAIIGTDTMKLINLGTNGAVWVEESSITAKITKHCKFNTFIENRYKNQLDDINNQLFNGKNVFNFSNRCNSCLGYCVEYYSKYLVYGESYLEPYVSEIKQEKGFLVGVPLNDCEIIRACMLKYKSLMCSSYGAGMAKIIKTMDISQLVEESNEEFVKTVVELGTKTAKFVKEKLYNYNKTIANIDPNLSIRHISGLADYITEDTILDVKVTNCIDKSMIKQVLGYHYLSTKRSDLHIKRLIVYDAVSGRYVEINL